MTYTALHPETGKPVRVHEENGRITAVESAPDEKADQWIAPGLIDIQVNGFAGVDYNSPHTPLDEIARSIEVQRKTGVTKIYPTVITGSNENTCGSLKNLAKAKRELKEGISFPGFHVEGPWISPVDGPRGAHPTEHCRAATIDEFKQFQDAAEGHIRLLTLAPEVEGTIPLIEHLLNAGVVVAIGHTNASEQDIQNAIAAGATMTTHLGNGAHQTVPRHENYIIYQMAADELVAGLIVDGIHLPPAFVKVAIRAKGLERSILVTDAVTPAGCPPGKYRIGDIEVELSAENRVERTDTRRLAGSALQMHHGVENLMRFTGMSLLNALRLGTVHPARAMKLPGRTGFLEAGDIADLFLFRFDRETKTIAVDETIIGGSPVA